MKTGADAWYMETVIREFSFDGGGIVASAGASVNRGERRDAFLAKLDGVVFADNASQGVVRNNTFYHAELGLVMKFADGWRVLNRPDRLRAIAPGGEAFIDVLLETPAKGVAPQDLLKRKVAVDGDVDVTPVNGHPAAIGNVRGANVRAGIVYLNQAEPQKAFALVGQAKTADALKRHLGAINATFKTVRAFADADKKLAGPLRIRIITAEAGTRYAELAKKSPLGRYAEEQLRLINAHYPAGEPTPGQKLKVIQ